MRHYNPSILKLIPQFPSLFSSYKVLLHNNNQGIFFTPQLTILKDLKKNKELTILATGPSINSIDLNTLRNTDFGLVNGSILLFNQLQIKDSTVYFLVTDPNYIFTHFKTIKKHISKAIICLFSTRAYYEIAKIDPDFLVSNKKQIFIINQLNEPYNAPKKSLDILKSEDSNNSYFIDSNCHFGFSVDIERGIFNGGTVVYGMLQCAAFIKYRDIKIYGMDLGGKERFYNELNPAISRLDQDYESLILPHMKLAKDFFNQNNTSIRNISHNSRLPKSVF